MSEWISANDELPRHCGWYNTYDNVASEFGGYQEVSCHYYQSLTKKWLSNRRPNEIEIIFDVTHWMPLPESPKEAEK